MRQLHYSGAGAAAVALFFLLFVPSLSAASGEELIENGTRRFGNGNYQSAILSFRDVVLNPSMESSHGKAYYWISRSYMAMEEYEKAGKNLEFFLAEYEGHSLYPDGLYQKGRLLHLQQEYQKSIRQLYRYIEEYPSHPYKANAYFWVGESLYSLGHYDKAEAMFTLVVRDYPRSYKVEAARYRLSLIDLKRREEELLKLLKLSHEEHLNAMEDFDRKQKSCQQAIAGYQRKLAAATADNDNELIDALNDDVDLKETRIRKLESENEELRDQVAALRRKVEEGGGTVRLPSGADSEVQRLLEIKERALSLKEYYIKQLSKRQGGQ